MSGKWAPSHIEPDILFSEVDFGYEHQSVQRWKSVTDSPASGVPICTCSVPICSPSPGPEAGTIPAVHPETLFPQFGYVQPEWTFSPKCCWGLDLVSESFLCSQKTFFSGLRGLLGSQATPNWGQGRPPDGYFASHLTTVSRYLFRGQLSPGLSTVSVFTRVGTCQLLLFKHCILWTNPCMHIWIIKEKWKKKNTAFYTSFGTSSVHSLVWFPSLTHPSEWGSF
jgi:hypothetical protein